MAPPKPAILENISEEYYQISEDILTSFPKYRPPVDLYWFREDILILQPYSRKGQRLTNEQVEAVSALCQNGSLFVSRSDHPIYAEHIVKQLDLILQDANLKLEETVYICIHALTLRLEAFADQPVLAFYTPLAQDLTVVIKFLCQNLSYVRKFLSYMYSEHSFVHHSINSLFVGLWLYLDSNDYLAPEKDLYNIALGLLLHDIGMTKIPQFIVGKASPLKAEETEKIPPHVLTGLKMLQKLDITTAEVRDALRDHHERLDGSGYPQKSKNEQVSKIGRLVATADSFCAMITTHPYAEKKSFQQAAQELAADRMRYDIFYTHLLVAGCEKNIFRLALDEPKEPTKEKNILTATNG